MGEAEGNFYWRQLMHNGHSKDWWLPDSPLQPYTQYLGDIGLIKDNNSLRYPDLL